MLIAPPAPREQERIALLHALRLLDSPPEEVFDRITRLIARVLDVPIAVVSLVDTDRQWFKSRVGLDASETSRDVAFCAHTIHGDEPMVIVDALDDVRFFDNPLVTAFPNIRFYAGAPILSSGGLALGTLCLIDTKPRHLDATEVQVLKDFTDLVRREVMNREALLLSTSMTERSDAEREQTETALRLLTTDLEHQVSARTRQLHAVLENAPDAYVGIDASGCIDDWNPQAERIFGWSSAEVMGKQMQDLLIPPVHQQTVRRMAEAVFGSVLNQRVELMALHRDGSEIPVELSLSVLPSDGTARYSAFMRDITERKQVDTALRRSREQMRAIADNVPAMIAHVDKNLTYTFANAGYRTLQRIEPGTMLGRTVSSVVGEESYAIMEPHLQQAMLGERSVFEVNDTAEHFWQVRLEPDIKDGQVQGFYMVTVDISGVKNAELAHKREASLDTLTGLPNRRSLMHELSGAIARANAESTGLGIFFLDLNGFKAINDTLGHDAGDELLRQFAQRLNTCMRRGDLVARLAGDEFIIIAEGLSRYWEDAQMLAVKIAQHLSEPFVLPAVAEPQVISASIGVHVHEPQQKSTPESLLAAADRAMYAAKHAYYETLPSSD